MIKPTKAKASALAILLLSSSSAVKGANWTPTAAGTFVWNTGGDWSAAVPNAAGAVANFNVGQVGNQTINMNQAITIGTLNAGDTGGTAGVRTTINSGSGGNALTFQSVGGAPTAINLTVGTASTGGASNLILPNINLAANSPMTITGNSTAPHGSLR